MQENGRRVEIGKLGRRVRRSDLRDERSERRISKETTKNEPEQKQSENFSMLFVNGEEGKKPVQKSVEQRVIRGYHSDVLFR